MRPDGGVFASIGPRSVRILVAACGVCSIAWAVLAFPSFRREPPLVASRQQILSGARYNAEQLSQLRSEVDTAAANSLRPSMLDDVAVIRLRLVEATLPSGDIRTAASDFNELEKALDVALIKNPTSSFLWLTEYWLQKQRSGNAADPRLLQMSYLLGPNEAWIAVRRGPVALSIFSTLPADIQKEALAEFTGLVRSGIDDYAADILAGPGRAIRDQLLSGLTEVDEATRRAFRRVLISRNLDDVKVPGLDEPVARPF